MAKAMNHKRRLRALEQNKPQRRRNLVALNALSRRVPHFVNKKKQASKKACRQPIPG
jgi:hypothetical protein